VIKAQLKRRHGEKQTKLAHDLPAMV